MEGGIERFCTIIRELMLGKPNVLNIQLLEFPWCMGLEASPALEHPVTEKSTVVLIPETLAKCEFCNEKRGFYRFLDEFYICGSCYTELRGKLKRFLGSLR